MQYATENKIYKGFYAVPELYPHHVNTAGQVLTAGRRGQEDMIGRDNYRFASITPGRKGTGPSVTLGPTGNKVTVIVAKLLLGTFYEIPEGVEFKKLRVLYKDGNRDNFSIENLQWRDYPTIPRGLKSWEERKKIKKQYVPTPPANTNKYKCWNTRTKKLTTFTSLKALGKSNGVTAVTAESIVENGYCWNSDSDLLLVSDKDSNWKQTSIPCFRLMNVKTGRYITNRTMKGLLDACIPGYYDEFYKLYAKNAPVKQLKFEVPEGHFMFEKVLLSLRYEEDKLVTPPKTNSPWDILKK